MQRPLYMRPQDALAYNIIDEIIQPDEQKQSKVGYEVAIFMAGLCEGGSDSWSRQGAPEVRRWWRWQVPWGAPHLCSR